MDGQLQDWLSGGHLCNGLGASESLLSIRPLTLGKLAALVDAKGACLFSLLESGAIVGTGLGRSTIAAPHTAGTIGETALGECTHTTNAALVALLLDLANSSGSASTALAGTTAGGSEDREKVELVAIVIVQVGRSKGNEKKGTDEEEFHGHCLLKGRDGECVE